MQDVYSDYPTNMGAAAIVHDANYMSTLMHMRRNGSGIAIWHDLKRLLFARDSRVPETKFLCHFA